MKKVYVEASKPYNVIIKSEILDFCGEEVSKVHEPCRVLIVTDSNVLPLYAERVKLSLENSGFNVTVFSFPAGESSKNLSTVEKIWDTLAKNSFSRKDIIVALGGGVTGDIAGFAASAYLRGIDFVQISTTLLSQVDSSVGGKTGVDLPYGKNLVGAFWQPKLVLIDNKTLNTLPKKFFTDGMGEVIKYGFIKDPKLLNLIEANGSNGFDGELLEEIVFRCISIKSEIVKNDELDRGERIILNFGHTLGHSIEKALNYEKITHGEAVAIGMLMITKATQGKALTENGVYERMLAVCTAQGLMTSIDIDLEKLVSGALNDKKASGNEIELVILKKTGQAQTLKLEKDKLYDFLKNE